jgi:hypothetical protein
VIAYCVATDAGAASDAGAAADVATVATFAGATPAVLATAAQPGFAVDRAGTKVLVATASGLFVHPIAGGAGTSIDAAGAIGLFTPDGSAVVYTTSAKALRRASLGASPATTTLVANGFSEVLAISPDGSWVLGDQSRAGQTSDMFLASTSAAGSATALSSATTAALFGDAFTADSSRALFYTNVSKGVGTFNAQATSGGAPTALGSNVWENYAATGTKVVFNQNYDRTNQLADIAVADVASTAPATVLVTQADAYFFLSPARDKVVYSWSDQPGGQEGVWVAPVP